MLRIIALVVLVVSAAETLTRLPLLKIPQDVRLFPGLSAEMLGVVMVVSLLFWLLLNARARTRAAQKRSDTLSEALTAVLQMAGMTVGKTDDLEKALAQLPNSLERRIQEANNRLDRFDRVLGIVGQRHADHSTMLATLRSRLDESDANFDRIRSDAEALERELGEAENTLMQHALPFVKVEADGTIRAQEVPGDLDQRLRALERVLDNLSTKGLSDLSTRLSNAMGRMKALEPENGDTTDDIRSKLGILEEEIVRHFPVRLMADDGRRIMLDHDEDNRQDIVDNPGFYSDFSYENTSAHSDIEERLTALTQVLETLESDDQGLRHLITKVKELQTRIKSIKEAAGDLDLNDFASDLGSKIDDLVDDLPVEDRGGYGRYEYALNFDTDDLKAQIDAARDAIVLFEDWVKEVNESLGKILQRS